jgi:hypothetical protein
MANKFDVDFGEFLYNRLPEIYRTEDANNSYTLEKFLDVLNEGGFKTIIDKLNGLDNLIDIDNIPAEYLKHTCSLFGFDYSTLDDSYNPVLPEWFIRRLLSNIMPLLRKKGTKSCINYIARELTGFKSSVIENKDFTDDDVSITGWDRSFNNRKNFILNLSAPEETSLIGEKEDAVAYAIKDFLQVWSQCYIITTYWYQDDRDIVGSESDEINSITETNTETKTVASISTDTDTLSVTELDTTQDSHTILQKDYTGGENRSLIGGTTYCIGTGGFLLNHISYYDIVKEDGKHDVYLF